MASWIKAYHNDVATTHSPTNHIATLASLPTITLEKQPDSNNPLDTTITAGIIVFSICKTKPKTSYISCINTNFPIQTILPQTQFNF
jgi:hypothetical protein